MKKQLLDWWKGKFKHPRGINYGTVNPYALMNTYYSMTDTNHNGIYSIWVVGDGVFIEGNFTLDQAYEASLIHYLQQNKGLLEIVFNRRQVYEAMIETKFRHKHDFETWFKEVTE